MTFRKQLIVNADDFGFTPDVNEGIVEAHSSGILTATTLMANGAAFDDAVRLARDHPSLDVGCHLVLVGGNSLLDGKPLPATLPQLLVALARRRIDAYGELHAQVQRILTAGIRPTHLDTHKHTHLAPPVLEAVARLSEEFGIRWVRRPFDFPLTAYSGAVPLGALAASRAMSVMGRKFQGILKAHHCRATNHFAGFQITGRFHTRQLVELLAAIPEGSTELMCHPGRCGAALRAAPTRLKESRAAELAALTAPEVRDAISRAGIELVSYAGVEFYSGG